MNPVRADPQIVERHLIALRRAVRELRRYEDVSARSLRADTNQRWAVERGLLLSIQNALDVAGHVASAEGHDPATYAGSIDALVEAGALPAEFGERFRGVAGFRNVIVLGYLELDLHHVARFLNENLDDFDDFAQHVERWLER